MLVEGPLRGSHTIWTTAFDLGPQGYVAEEYFLSGSARSFRHVLPPADDGHWLVEPAESKSYVTRLVLNRPADMSRFSGTVCIEWLNVSGGLDAAPGWLYAHRELMRSGDVWVGVSAQKVGIDGGGLGTGMHLKAVDPGRYDRLELPGDAYSYDIFTQAIEAARSQLGVLEGNPGHMLAMGSSQSAMALLTYINAIDAHAELVDGYLIHGRGAEAMPLNGDFIPWEYGENRTGRHRVRPDARVPVLTLQSETDVVLLGGGRARQPDTQRFRLWEVAGAAHFDTYGLHASLYDDGSKSPSQLAGLVTAGGATEPTVGRPYSRAWQMHYVLQAAIAALKDGTTGNEATLPRAHRLGSADPDGSRLLLDNRGLVSGGIRTPWVEVPTAVHSGVREEGSGPPYDLLFGETIPFDPDVLECLYPGGRGEYLERFAIALGESVESGFILQADEAEILAVAEAEWRGLS